MNNSTLKKGRLVYAVVTPYTPNRTLRCFQPADYFILRSKIEVPPWTRSDGKVVCRIANAYAVERLYATCEEAEKAFRKEFERLQGRAPVLAEMVIWEGNEAYETASAPYLRPMTTPAEDLAA